MSVKKKIIIAIIAIVLIAGIIVGCIFAFTAKEENVRDMSEIVKRGSFVMSVDDQKDVLSDINKTYVFKTYKEFTANSISNLITYTTFKDVNGKNIEFKYKAKNERYNEDYFEDNDLLVVFFEETINTISRIVNDVRRNGNAYEIDVYADMPTGSWGLRDEKDVIYACFIENKEIDKDAEASVNVCDIFKTNSVESYYFNSNLERINIPNQKTEAYLLSDFEKMEQFISDNPNIINEGLLSFVLRDRYPETFYRYNSLMIFVVPSEYGGDIIVNNNIFNGIILYSDHYLKAYQKDNLEDNFNYTCVISVPISKSFDYDEIQYGHTLYYAWEEGIENVKVETAPMTLKAQNTESGYIKYVLKTGE